MIKPRKKKRGLCVELRINSSAVNLVVVCVDRTEDHNFKGRFYHKYQTEAVPFRTGEELMVRMEEFYNAINIPQAATVGRGFLNRSPAPVQRKTKIVQEVGELMAHKGDIATFVIHVQYRQNATWQGRMTWADKNSNCNFRSALEMLKMMDQAIESSAPENKDAETLQDEA